MMAVLVSAGLLLQAPGPIKASLEGTIHECARLYKLRNDFYNRIGLCFTRAGALELYPNNPRTCRYASGEDLPISASQRQWVNRIVAKERELGCAVIRP